ncbi:L,D-transpeptidase family protein [Actibacterium lipolyticum]|uniref:L,D-transpeptidase catalytic domain n=1 Tax=Actibacterium lipolyticum TaxID=1524263 RepID=A0A238JKR1_9RHOB|nr:L,D-transpeptidase family protein [Actibacterium lipolyticum]SMX30794.1 L,D-transpeptidase catalytic domain [Actibacterium lipolyticum]
MTKLLGRLFSALTLVTLLVAGAIYLQSRLPPPPPLAPITGQIDKILIEKANRRMTLFQNGTPVREYKIALGFAPAGHKTEQGDGRTPEGVYKIDRRNPRSKYHLSLGLDYPRAQDRQQAAARGVDPGGDIFIHGQPNGLGRIATLPNDWTAGCIAVANEVINEIWAATPVGTEVEIRP